MCRKELEAIDMEKDEIKFDRWTQMEYTRKDDSTKEFYDFKETTVPFEQFYDEVKKMAPKFLVHHDLARSQDDDWDICQNNFPRGHFCSVQDFSEGHGHKTKDEHQSKYFNEVVTTLYGCVLRFHLADVSDTFLGESDAAAGAALRLRLDAAFEKQGLDPDNRRLTYTLAISSSDRQQDSRTCTSSWTPLLPTASSSPSTTCAPTAARASTRTLAGSYTSARPRRSPASTSTTASFAHATARTSRTQRWGA